MVRKFLLLELAPILGPSKTRKFLLRRAAGWPVGVLGAIAVLAHVNRLGIAGAPERNCQGRKFTLTR
jgi:hypothetical protein